MTFGAGWADRNTASQRGGDEEGEEQHARSGASGRLRGAAPSSPSLRLCPPVAVGKAGGVTYPRTEALRAAHVFIDGDKPWQAELRLRQSLWRQRLGIPPGVVGERAVGSRLPAGDRNSNFLTPAVATAVEEARAQTGALVSAPRVYENLLSSQPLAFNLFAEAATDPALRTATGRALWPDLLAVVDRVGFEWSPGRSDRAFLGNRSAFDVVITGRDPAGRSALVGIEVKYHEDMTQDPGKPDNPRYGEVATASGVFRDPNAPALRQLPLRQIWFDHLLALSTIGAGTARARFVLLAPAINPAATAVDAAYREHLVDALTYERRSLEEVAAVVRWCAGPGWADQFAERYLAPTPQ